MKVRKCSHLAGWPLACVAPELFHCLSWICSTKPLPFAACCNLSMFANGCLSPRWAESPPSMPGLLFTVAARSWTGAARQSGPWVALRCRLEFLIIAAKCLCHAETIACFWNRGCLLQWSISGSLGRAPSVGDEGQLSSNMRCSAPCCDLTNWFPRRSNHSFPI